MRKDNPRARREGFISERSEATKSLSKAKGFAIIEIILAVGLFTFIVGGAVGVVVQAFNVNRLGEEESSANSRALEGLEAARAIAGRSYLNLTNGPHGLTNQNSFWEFSGSSESLGKFTRQIIASDVFRDANGEIIGSGGSLDPFTKRVEALVTWSFSPGRANSVSLKSYFTNLQESTNLGGDVGCRGVSGDWRNPVTLGTVDLGPGNEATGLDVKQKIVYMSAEASAAAKPDFFIVDATDGQNPFIRSNLNTGPGLNAVDAANTFAYVANKATNAQLQIIDVANLNSPVLVSSFQLPGISGNDAVGRSVFYYAGKVYIGTKRVTTGPTNPEFHIVDVSNPAVPVWLGSKEIDADVNKIYVTGTTAYLATSDAQELKIFDVSNPANITQIGGFDASGNSEDGKSLSVVGNKLYLGRTIGGNHVDHHELHVLDIGNPALIVNLGSKDLASDVNGILTCGNLALIGTSDPNKEFQVWNVADPANIVFWSSLNFPQVGTGVDYEGNFVYLSVRSNDALRIITSQ